MKGTQVRHVAPCTICGGPVQTGEPPDVRWAYFCGRACADEFAARREAMER